MKQQLVDKFQQIYGDGAVTGIYFAPGRVNLIGEHTDYNGGHVFPCAITMGTYALVRKRTAQPVSFLFSELSGSGSPGAARVGAGLEEGTWMGQLSKGNDLYIDEERGARDLRNGSAVLWRYSKRSGDWLFCFVGSGDRTDHQRPDGDQRSEHDRSGIVCKTCRE